MTYIWDGDSWESIGNIQGASGEGVASGGDDGDLLVKDSTDEFKTKWVAVNDAYNHETPSALASSAKAIKEGVVHVMDALHPAGSIYITDGENPYNLIDVGESTDDWELIDKGFKSDVLTANSTDYFTPDTGVQVVSNTFKAFRDGRRIRVLMDIKFTSTVSTSTIKTLGLVNLTKLGVDTSKYKRTGDDYMVNYCDATNSTIGYWVTLDLVQALGQTQLRKKRSGQNIDSTGVIHVDFAIDLAVDEMLDEECDKFYWKRVDNE